MLIRALAGQSEAAENVAEARETDTALIAAAQAAGAALVAAGEADAAQADDNYATAWHASRDAGWNPVQLRSMGYAKPPAARRSASSAGVAEQSTDGADDDEHVQNVA